MRESQANSITMDVVRDCSPARPKLTKTSERHPKLVLEQINQIRRSCCQNTGSSSFNDQSVTNSTVNELCDVILHVGSSKIKAHKIILSASSPYFRAMFTSELAESRQSEVSIRDIDETAMEMLVDFCYSSKITIDEKTVQTLLPAACLLQMEEVQDYCSEFLRSQLDPSNCLGIRAFADTHSCTELLKIADTYLQNHFVDIIESDEFLFLPADQLAEIISKDELNVKGEEQVYLAAMKWIRHNLNERMPQLSRLMLHVRFPLIDTKFLVTKISTDQLVRQCQVCRDLIDEAKDYHLMAKESTVVQNPTRVRPRKPIITGEVLFAVGGWCSGDAISCVEMYDPQSSSEWTSVASMGKRRCGVGVGVLNNQIYAIGGHDGATYLNSTERYDPALNQWFNDVASTNTCRTSVGVAVLDGFLYAVGGQDGVSCLSLVDKYDPVANRWSRVALMSTRRLGVALVVLGSYLYAVGGSDGSSPLNSVERYDPKTNRWTAVAPMLIRRKHLGCAVYHDMIYAVGGRDDLAELNSAERYNSHTNKWELIVPMKSRRSGVGLAVLNGTLMAIGGFDGSSYLKTCESYDPEANSWKLSSSMNYRRLGSGVGVLNLSKDQFGSRTEVKTLNSDSNSQSKRFSPTGSTSASSWPLILTPLPSLLANVPQSTGTAASNSSPDDLNELVLDLNLNNRASSIASITVSPNSGAAIITNSSESTSNRSPNSSMRLVDI